MSSIDDLAVIAQNLVLAVNGLQQAYLSNEGSASMENITAATLVKKGAGRVARISVLVAGSATGMVYDAASTSLVAASNRIAVIPNTVGVIEIHMPAESGIVVSPGTGQEVSVSYS